MYAYYIYMSLFGCRMYIIQRQINLYGYIQMAIL